MTRKDIPDAMRLKELAGWNQTSADWERFLAANPKGCFIAEMDGRRVGTVTTIIYEERFAWVGMVLVDPQFRGRGIGKALLEGAIAHLNARNITCIKLDATPQGKPLYEKLGFVTEYEIERWAMKKQQPLGLPMTKRAPLEAVLKLDREVFGADRGALLQSISDSAPEFVQILATPTEVNGYVFGRHGALADSLGPWVARDEHAAAMLLDSFLSRSSRELVFVDCLKSNPWATRLVETRGFEFGRPLTRMYRGINAHPGRTELVFGFLGPEFG
ncbi:MAG: GNAT family N-acetyltransferase [Terriglobia bacterium]